MPEKTRKIIKTVLIFIVYTVLLCSCTDKDTANTNVKGSVGGQVIRIATHSVKEIDPEWRDDITGEPYMSPETLRAAQKAVESVKKKLNVDLEFLQYSGDVREVLLQSVLANDPVAELVILWNGSQGTVLGQNVLQPLDEYAHIFLDDPEAEWILLDKMFGHYYLMNRDFLFIKQWPLVYNIKYIEAVDALKENGQTVYPSDLYERGEWTWSKFEEYLSKIDAYYKGKPSPVRPNVPIKAFQTDYKYTAAQAIHSNGATVYGENGIEFDTPEAKQAIAYIDGLMSKGYMMSVRNNDNDPSAGWTWHANDFANGETVFTNMVLWMGNSASNKLAGRGESMGIIPFPRPDHLAIDDPRYNQYAVGHDSVGVLKGISKETTRLALEAYKEYKNAYYRALANSDNALDYFETNAASEALAFGIDILHEKVGKANFEFFKSIASTRINEFADQIGIWGLWGNDILGESIYGLNGSPKYSIAVDSEKSMVIERLASMENALRSEKANDNIAPKISKKSNKPIAFPAGTDPAGIDWSTIFKAEDNIDGSIDFSNAVIDIQNIDFNHVGKYEKGITVSIKDSSGNETESSQDVIIYDPDNKVPPTIVVKENYRKLSLDEDVSKINWGGDFIESAEDKDGFDIKSNIKADVTELDTTTPGTYTTEITVTDFAGNVAKTVLELTVE